MTRILVLLCLPLILAGQKKTTRYYDGNWQLTVRDNAAYYRKIQYDGQGKPAGLTRDYYITGEKQWEGKVLSENPDVNDSLCLWYHKNGKVQQRTFYENGKVEGELLLYFESGKLKETSLYKLGFRQGISSTYYESGKLHVKGNYIDGLKEGPFFYYHENGQVSDSTFYIRNKKEGESLNYYSDGKLELRHHYLSDTLHGPWIRFSSLGDTLASGQYLKGKETGKWVIYYSKGILNQNCVYEPELLRKKCTTYHENGIKSQEDWTEGDKSEAKMWHRNGNPTAHYRFTKNIQQGRNQEYYSNGQLRTDFLYENGKQVGESRSYYPNGKIYSAEIFQPDGKLSSWKTYYPNGKQETIREYDAQGNVKVFARFEENGQSVVAAPKIKVYNDSASAGVSNKEPVSYRLAKDNAACLYGFKDEQGKWLLAPQFTTAKENEYGYIVSKGEKFGLVSEGKIIIPLEYDGLASLGEPSGIGYSSRYMTAYKGKKAGIINFQNKPITAFDYESTLLGMNNTFLLKKNDKYRIQNAKGDLIPTPMKFIEKQHEKFIVFRENHASMDFFGLADWQGNVILPMRFQEVSELSPGVFKVKTKTGLYGLFQVPGTYLADTVYSNIKRESPQLFSMVKEGQSGLLQMNGQWLVPMNSSKKGHEVRGNFIILREEKAQLLYTDLRPVSPRKWDEIQFYSTTSYAFSRSFPDYWFLVKENGRYQVLDTAGRNALPGTYLDFGLQNYSILILDNGRKLDFYQGEFGTLIEKDLKELNMSNRLFSLGNGNVVVDNLGNVLFRSANTIYTMDNEQGYYTHDEKGQTILYRNGQTPRIFPEHWENIEQLDELHTAVMNTLGKWGVVDNEMNLLIPTVYDVIGCYEPALKGIWAKVEVAERNDEDYGGQEIEGKWGIVNSTGKYMLAPEYQFPMSFNKEGIAVLTKESGTGIINTKGEIVLPFVYEEIYPWSNSLYLLKKDNKYGAVNSKGAVLFPPEWDNVTTFQGGHAVFYQGKRQGILDTNGKVVLPLKESSFVSTNVNIGHYFNLTNSGEGPTEWKEVIPGYEKIARYKEVKLRRSISNLLISTVLENSNLDNIYLYDFIRKPCVIKYKEPYDFSSIHGHGEISYLNLELIVADKQSFSYEVTLTSAGRGYSNENYYISNFGIMGDSIYGIGLQDLFIPYSNYRSQLSKLLAKEIMKLDNPEIDCSNPGELAERYRDMWYISSKGLNFMLRGENASYEEEITIPYKDLASMINLRGPLGAWGKQKVGK